MENNFKIISYNRKTGEETEIEHWTKKFEHIEVGEGEEYLILTQNGLRKCKVRDSRIVGVE